MTPDANQNALIQFLAILLEAPMRFQPFLFLWVQVMKVERGQASTVSASHTLAAFVVHRLLLLSGRPRLSCGVAN
jgi:hypothetical protein